MKVAVNIWLDDPRIEKDGDFYVAYSDQLKLLGCGNTESDAYRELKEVINTSMKALLKEGMLFKTLEKLGIQYEIVKEQRINKRHSRKPMLLEAVG